MDYQLTIVRTPTYLHATGTGDHTADNVRRFLADAHRAAVASNCDAMLLEMRFSGPSLALGSIYSIVAEASRDGSWFKRIAYVDANPTHSPDRAEFAEVAANKLGVNMRLFRSVTEAESWFLGAAAVASAGGSAG
jgi:hypothetical protein